MQQTTLTYLAAGLAVLPAKRDEKRPAVSTWKQYQQRLPTQHEVSAWFANNHDALCILTGTVSGNLEIIDFDNKAELFEQWKALIVSAIPSVFKKLTIQRTQSGGLHVIYRSDEPVNGNMKLAQRENGDRVITLIETRGEGGLFLCAPTAGYELIQGGFDRVPTINADDRDMLLSAAWELNEYSQPTYDVPKAKQNDSKRPGDEFNARGDIRDTLLKHGWQLARQGTNEYWRRPGKTKGWSATLKDRVFYVFSANAYPFEPNRAYAPFAVYAFLEYGGDFARAAEHLHTQGYGDSLPVSSYQTTLQAPLYVDPGAIPDDLLYVPGFISEVMNYTLTTAPYPNRVLAFAGAVILQSFLAGRKVRDELNNRTNLYILALAGSGAGKDRPRAVNSEILFAVGMSGCIGEDFASGEGLQDALYESPAMLFQPDEIDHLIRAINTPNETRKESISRMLLSVYTSSKSIMPMRVKAGEQTSDAIDQPHLCLFGTAIPDLFYQALSEQMLTNGFFSRLMVFDADTRGKHQRPAITDLPESIIKTAQWWSDFTPGKTTGNLSRFHPEPQIVSASTSAAAAIDRFWDHADRQHDLAIQNKRETERTLWTRAIERLCKLSLLYAISENHEQPEINIDAVEWAQQIVEWQTKRMLYMVKDHVARNEFDGECLRVMRFLKGKQEVAHGELLRHMRCKAKDLKDIIDALVLQEQIAVLPVESSGRGRPTVVYRAV